MAEDGHPPHRCIGSEGSSDGPVGQGGKRQRKRDSMLYTLATIILVLWLLGLLTSYTMGGAIHILLLIALIMILANVFSGRRRA